jgi:hypothetical protein
LVLGRSGELEVTAEGLISITSFLSLGGCLDEACFGSPTVFFFFVPFFFP